MSDEDARRRAADLADELEAVASIYGDTLTVVPPDAGDDGDGATRLTVRVPVSGADHDAIITLSLHAGYPDVPPTTSLEGAPRGVRDAVAAAVAGVLAAHAAAPAAPAPITT